MKKIRYIIATIFVVAIGTIVFLSCDKNKIEEDSITLETQQAQKNGEDIFYYYVDDPGVYYWANSGITFSLDNEIVLEEGNLKGVVNRDTDNNITYLFCSKGGTNCGVAKEIDDSGSIIREGLWVEEANIIYVVFNE